MKDSDCRRILQSLNWAFSYLDADQNGREPQRKQGKHDQICTHRVRKRGSARFWCQRSDLHKVLAHVVFKTNECGPWVRAVRHAVVKGSIVRTFQGGRSPDYGEKKIKILGWICWLSCFCEKAYCRHFIWGILQREVAHRDRRRASKRVIVNHNSTRINWIQRGYFRLNITGISPVLDGWSDVRVSSPSGIWLRRYVEA